MTYRDVDHGNQVSLGNLVHCGSCGRSMAHTGQIYYCPGAGDASGQTCTTDPVDAQALLYAVFTGLIRRMATDDMISYVAEVIHAIHEPRANVLRQQMDSAESILADANARDPRALHFAHNRATYYQDTTAATDVRDQLTAESIRSSMAARDELDMIAFIGDERGIRQTATDPATFLESDSSDGAQELLDLLVEKVMVDSTSALIMYQMDMPTALPWETVTEDRVELYPERMP